MPVYKDDNTGKWYFSIRYKDVYGNNKRKMQRAVFQLSVKLREQRLFLNDVNEGYSDSKTFDYVFHHYLENSDLRPKTKRRKQNEYHKTL